MDVVSKWVPPPVHAKLNADAEMAMKESGSFLGASSLTIASSYYPVMPEEMACRAIAAVCRAVNGDFLGALALVIHGISNLAILEAMDCREVLALAVDLNISRARIASDCMEVVNSVKGTYLGKFTSVMNDIYTRSRELDEVDLFTSEDIRTRKRMASRGP
ncbi:hypothetical protein ACQ4PT_046127 [Festuca glaucescens]